jgi:hypothetical protein
MAQEVITFADEVVLNEEKKKEKDKKKFDRFYKGLISLKYTDEQIKNIMNTWICCGIRARPNDEGEIPNPQSTYSKWTFVPDGDNHIYLNPIVKYQYEYPKWFEHCVCGQRLFTRNAWITYDEEDPIIEIGICCKDMFLKNGKKVCEKCKMKHFNRSDDLCTPCRLIRDNCKNCKTICKAPNDDLCKTCRKKVFIAEQEAIEMELHRRMYEQRATRHSIVKHQEFEKYNAQQIKQCKCGKVIKGSYKHCYKCNEDLKKLKA